MEHSQSTITAINHQRTKRINFHYHSLLSGHLLKKFWLLLRGYFGSLGHAVVAVVERFKQEPMYVSIYVAERWPLVEVLQTEI